MRVESLTRSIHVVLRNRNFCRAMTLTMGWLSGGAMTCYWVWLMVQWGSLIYVPILSFHLLHLGFISWAAFSPAPVLRLMAGANGLINGVVGLLWLLLFDVPARLVEPNAGWIFQRLAMLVIFALTIALSGRWVWEDVREPARNHKKRRRAVSAPNAIELLWRVAGFVPGLVVIGVAEWMGCPDYTSANWVLSLWVVVVLALIAVLYSMAYWLAGPRVRVTTEAMAVVLGYYVGGWVLLLESYLIQWLSPFDGPGLGLKIGVVVGGSLLILCGLAAGAVLNRDHARMMCSTAAAN